MVKIKKNISFRKKKQKYLKKINKTKVKVKVIAVKTPKLLNQKYLKKKIIKRYKKFIQPVFPFLFNYLPGVRANSGLRNVFFRSNFQKILGSEIRAFERQGISPFLLNSASKAKFKHKFRQFLLKEELFLRFKRQI